MTGLSKLSIPEGRGCAERWTVRHQVAHLAWTDRAVLSAIEDPASFAGLRERFAADPDVVVLLEDQWVRLIDCRLSAPSRHHDPGEAPEEDDTECVVPVRWIVHVPQAEAYRGREMFDHQNSAGKRGQQFTAERLTAPFVVHDEVDDT